MKIIAHLWLRIVSTFLDMAAIYSMASLLQIIIYKITFCPFSFIFIVTFIAYYLLSYLSLEGRTPGKIFTNLRIVTPSGETPGIKKLLLREVLLKGLLGIIIPLYLFSNIPLRTHFLKTAGEMLLILFIYFIYLLIYKITWWEHYSGTSTIKEKVSSKKSLTPAIGILLTIFILYDAVSVYPLIRSSDCLTQQYSLLYPPTSEVQCVL